MILGAAKPRHRAVCVHRRANDLRVRTRKWPAPPRARSETYPAPGAAILTGYLRLCKSCRLPASRRPGLIADIPPAGAEFTIWPGTYAAQSAGVVICRITC